jgi:cytoskeleton protein RodZ
MSEAAASAAGNDSAPTSSAGTILRQARKAKGLHLAAIAATIKVAPAKLEALENDRFDQLPDATFTRALAQAMCRVLRIDAQPVLARLPQAAGQRLERLEGGLRQPFHERPGQAEPRDWSALRSPAVWGPALLVLGAALLLLVPLDALRPRRAAPAADAQSNAASAARPSVVAMAASAPASAATAASAAIEAEASRAGPMPAGAVSAGASGVPLELQARGETWVEVRDAQGRVLLSRTLHKGEKVSLDTRPPLRVRIGNAKDTRLVFRGEAIDPSKTTRDNIARLELQ